MAFRTIFRIINCFQRIKQKLHIYFSLEQSRLKILKKDCFTPLPPPTSGLRNNLSKDDSALFSRFLYGLNCSTSCRTPCSNVPLNNTCHLQTYKTLSDRSAPAENCREQGRKCFFFLVKKWLKMAWEWSVALTKALKLGNVAFSPLRAVVCC